MKIASVVSGALATLTCLGGTWSCGGQESASDGPSHRDAAQMRTPAVTPSFGERHERGAAARDDECTPIGVKRRDYFLHVVSTMPRTFGERARLDIHRVSPIYEHGWCDQGGHRAGRAAILVHGASNDGVTVFDLQYPKAAGDGDAGEPSSTRHAYSMMESLAYARVDAFAVSLLGYGLSTRFQMDDPCNASLADQQSFLTPIPLDSPCTQPPDPYRFTNSQAGRDQISSVIDHVLEEAGVEKVSLFAWSRGGNVVAGYTSLDSSKVDNLVLLASEFELKGNPQLVPMLIADRTKSFVAWNSQISPACAGQQDPAIQDAIWTSARLRDPLGATWGSQDEQTGGVRRAPTWELSGWDTAAAKKVTAVPTLVISGLLDTQNPTATELRLFNALGTTHKAMLKIQCASHNALWEGSTGSGWSGPHAAVTDAAVQWITAASYNGHEKGTFTMDSAGAVRQDGQ